MQEPNSNHRVTFSVLLVAPEGGRDELVRTFRALLGPIRGTAGCLRCHLLEDVQQPDEVTLQVEWSRQEAFERHVRSELFRKILQAVELAAKPPDLEIQTIAGVRGMGLLREILGCEEG